MADEQVTTDNPQAAAIVNAVALLAALLAGAGVDWRDMIMARRRALLAGRAFDEAEVYTLIAQAKPAP